MLQAYVDDSVSEVGDRHFILAGYFGKAETWIKFSREWQRALRKAPKIDYLHTVEARGLRGQFGGWDPLERDKKLLKMAKVVRKFQFRSIYVSVSRLDYENIILPLAPYNLQSPYYICFYTLIIKLAEYLNETHAHVPVDFVFDEHGQIGRDAVAWYYAVKEDNPRLKHLLGGTPIFEDDKHVLPLQAADMLAWHIRRIKESRAGDDAFALCGSDLIGDQVFLEANITKQHLSDIATKMADVPDVSVAQTKKSWKQMRPAIEAQLARGITFDIVLSKKPQGALKHLAAFIRAKFLRGFRKAR